MTSRDILRELGINESSSGVCHARWVEQPGGQELCSYSPIDGALLGTVRQAGEADYEAVMATGAVELVIPFGDRFGVMGQAGLSARAGTDQVAPFQGINFAVAKNGFMWGVQLALLPFVRF